MAMQQSDRQNVMLIDKPVELLAVNQQRQLQQNADV